MPTKTEPTRAELTVHNKRVHRWAKACDPQYLNVLLLIGYPVNLNTGTSWPSLRGMVKRSAEQEAKVLGIKQVSKSTVCKHLNTLERLGLVERIRDPKQDERDGVTVYRPDFSHVVVRGRLVPFDFKAPFDGGELPHNAASEIAVPDPWSQPPETVSPPAETVSEAVPDKLLNAQPRTVQTVQTVLTITSPDTSQEELGSPLRDDNELDRDEFDWSRYKRDADKPSEKPSIRELLGLDDLVMIVG